MKKVAVIMGSDSDWPVVKAACQQLDAFGIPYEAHILSAHRSPVAAADFAKNARANGFGVLICAAGMAAHLAGAFAGNSTLPVIGIPMKGGAVDGLDALLSTVQMPSGIPVATVAINGAKNAAVLAAQLLAVCDDALAETLDAMLYVGEDALARDPFSPKILNLMAYAHGALGNKLQEKMYYNKVKGVLRAIEDSGDALTQKTPRHILMFDHALDVMASEGYTYGKSRIISRTVEFIPFTAPRMVGDKKRKGLYYDFGRVYWNKPEGYTYKRDRTWQFNNLKPRTYK